MKPLESISLQPLEQSDARPLLDLINANRSMLHKFWWEQHMHTAKDTSAYIEQANTTESEAGLPTRAIRLHDTLIGVGGIHSLDQSMGRAALGYWLGEAYGGHGYGTQVVHKLVEVAFTSPAITIDSLAITTRATNTASRAVAEKAGFTLEAIDTHAGWHGSEGLAIETAHYAIYKSES